MPALANAMQTSAPRCAQTSEHAAVAAVHNVRGADDREQDDTRGGDDCIAQHVRLAGCDLQARREHDEKERGAGAKEGTKSSWSLRKPSEHTLIEPPQSYPSNNHTPPAHSTNSYPHQMLTPSMPPSDEG